MRAKHARINLINDQALDDVYVIKINATGIYFYSQAKDGKARFFLPLQLVRLVTFL